MRLNQFIAHAGLCARRKADALIRRGDIRVNGAVIQTLGYAVQPADEVFYRKKRLSPAGKVYLLFHKPLNCLTTLRDPQGRKTVVDYVRRLSLPRLYPVGRLDRNTSGLLLLTNDGLLAQGLAHPAAEIPKTYEVTLKKSLEATHVKRIRGGLSLEDGKAHVDSIEPLRGSRRHWTLQLHSGKNRIIRRLFAALDHCVQRLARTGYAHLTLGGLPPGRHRPLSAAEVTQLQAAVRRRKKPAKNSRGILA